MLFVIYGWLANANISTGCKKLCVALAGNNTITELHLSGNKLDDKCGTEIATILEVDTSQWSARGIITAITK